MFKFGSCIFVYYFLIDVEADDLVFMCDGNSIFSIMNINMRFGFTIIDKVISYVYKDDWIFEFVDIINFIVIDLNDFIVKNRFTGPVTDSI